MTPNSPLAKGTIPFVLVFSLIGLFSLWVAGDDFYHWYVTGYLYFPTKYGRGVYTSYGEVRGLFVAAVLKNLLVMVMGIVTIVAACTAPSFFRKKEQASSRSESGAATTSALATPAQKRQLNPTSGPAIVRLLAPCDVPTSSEIIRLSGWSRGDRRTVLGPIS
jgi:hypothetical protein